MKLYFSVGISGSGKTHYHQIIPYTILVDSDATRAELYGDAAIQGNPQEVFGLMRQKVLAALYSGKSVYYCATNLSQKRRIQFIRDIRQKCPNTKFECIIFVTSFENAIKNMENRKRKVPKDVVWHQMLQFEIPTYDEGWDAIYVQNDLNPTPAYMMRQKLNEFGSQHNSHHELSLGGHCLQCEIEAIKRWPNDYILHQAAYWHDVGKMFTQVIGEDGEAHYPNHSNIGAYVALNVGVPLTACQIIGYHMMPWMNEAAKATYKKRLGEKLWNDVIRLHECDIAASKLNT